MLDILNIETLLLALVVIVIFQSLLLTVMYLRMEREKRAIFNPEESYFIRKAKLKSGSILYTAIQEANRMLVSAELRGIKLFAKQKQESSKTTKEYEEHLDDLVKEMSKRLEMTQDKTQHNYDGFLQQMGEKIGQSLTANQEVLDAKAVEFLENTQERINKFVNDVNHRVEEQIEKELGATNKAIDDYRRHRMALVDEHIIDVVEKTIMKTLGKKLTVDDQEDLVFKALEEAKKEQFFGS